MVIAVPVIVNVAVRSAPVLGATANCTVPFPEPDAPCVTVRKLALLVAVHEQVAGVDTEIDADPPAAGNVVVVIPVMILHDDDAGFLLQAIATSRAAAETMMRIRQVMS